ncbi:unnamed protein product [Boreogadus saida]
MQQRLRTAQVLRSHRSLLFLRLALFLPIQVNILRIWHRWHRTSGPGCHVLSTGIRTRIRTRGASTGPASRGPSTGLTSRGPGRAPSTGLASRRPGRGLASRRPGRGLNTGPASRGPSTGLTSHGHGHGRRPSTGLASCRPAGRGLANRGPAGRGLANRGLASRRLNPGPDNRRPSTRPASRGPTGAVRRISGASRPLLSMWTRKAFMSHISTLKTFELS